MIERLHRHVHSQLSKYITSVRQRQAFLSLENGFSSFNDKNRGKQAFSLFSSIGLADSSSNLSGSYNKSSISSSTSSASA